VRYAAFPSRPRQFLAWFELASAPRTCSSNLQFRLEPSSLLVIENLRRSLPHIHWKSKSIELRTIAVPSVRVRDRSQVIGGLPRRIRE
jgi:hypothetical protein